MFHGVSKWLLAGTLWPSVDARTPYEVRRLMVKSFSWVRDMGAEIQGEETKSVAEILERIRARLSEQIKTDFAAGRGNSSQSSSEQVSIPRLRVLLDSARSLHSQVGDINPRPSGLSNDLIQLFKKAVRRILRWYTRPIVYYQEATLHLLGEVVEVLERDESRLQSLEAQVGLLVEELADLRQRTLAKLERIANELEKRQGE